MVGPKAFVLARSSCIASDLRQLVQKTKITKSAVDEVILKRSLSTLILPHQKAEFSIQR